jgi:hypothetical protein
MSRNMKRAKYFKDSITERPHQFWITKQISENEFKIIYITKEYSTREIGDILDKNTNFYTVQGHHIIVEISEKEAENMWLYKI